MKLDPAIKKLQVQPNLIQTCNKYLYHYSYVFNHLCEPVTS